MKPLNAVFNLFLIAVFFLGLYLFASGKLHSLLLYENMNTDPVPTPPVADACPDLLIRREGGLFLYRTQAPIQDGVNPLVFQHLDEYTAYYNNQKNAGVQCPVLFLQQESNVQGQDVYRVRPSPFELQGGLPPLSSMSNPAPVVIDRKNPVVYNESSIDNPPYNKGQYAGYDPQGQFVGKYTTLDKVHDSTEQLFPNGSPNPMDANWGGVLFTENILRTGYYDENNVQIKTA